MQGQGIECFTANPGIVNTPLNGPKLDHNKLTGNLMDISSSLAGQTTEEASICITRAATDPALEGMCKHAAHAIYSSGTQLALPFMHPSQQRQSNALWHVSVTFDARV